jgi:ArsR family transcriptional regulator
MRTDLPVQDTAEDLCCPAVSAALDRGAAEELAAKLKALADPTRLQLLSIVVAAPSGEVCACDLPAMVDRSQSTVSHHLSVLVEEGLLHREQRGKWAWFSAERGVLQDVATALVA